jgi:hypothetical protein
LPDGARVQAAATEGLGPHKAIMRARCGHCSACASNQMLRRMFPTAERTVTPIRQPVKSQKAIDRRDAIRERPLRCKSLEENFDGRIDSDHVYGLLLRLMTAGPDEVRVWSQTIERLREPWFQRVLRIIGSTDRHLVQLFHPASTRGQTVLDSCLAAFPRVIVAYAS